MIAARPGIALSLPVFLAACCVMVVLGGSPAGYAETPAAPKPESKQEPQEYTLVYASDYVSFVGGDKQGRVAFALDTNRGRDGDEWQAEHFVVLHDEHKGWQKVEGGGAFKNESKKVNSIPDSPFFQYRGSPANGLSVKSLPNDLELRIDPIQEWLSRAHGGGQYRMGSARATLEWAGRSLEGRIIYEFLMIPDFNRLTRTYFGLWKEYQGFYASLDGTGDLYLHTHKSDMLAPLTGNDDGFLVLDGQPARLDEMEIRVLDRRMAFGFYRWPTRWRMIRRGGDETTFLEIQLSEQKVIGNWAFGGFAMGIIRGELSVAGRTHSVYGLAELIM